MIDDTKDWMRARAGKLLVGTTGTLLALSLLSLGTSLLGDSSADAEAQADQVIAGLQEDLKQAEADLDAKHAGLLAELPGLDVERTDRDRATVRSVILSLTASSSSSRSTHEVQAALDARYGFLDTGSRTLTEFIPEWRAATGSTHGTGHSYELAVLDVDATGIKGLDYTYSGVARLDPVAAGEAPSAKSEYVVFTTSTRQDGSVSGIEAYRASSRTRDHLAPPVPAAEATASPGTDTAPDDGD